MHTQETELKKIAEDIREYQERSGFSDAALCREYRDLGSSKTYKRILDGDFDQMDVERQLNNYAKVLELTTIKPDPDIGAIYRDFAHVRQALLSVKEAFAEKGNEHLIIIEGPTGSGKTEVLRLIEKEFPTAAMRTEAHGGWKIGNNPLTIMCADLLEAASLIERDGGKKSEVTEKAAATEALPASFAARKNKLFTALRQSKRILLIDEAQEMGPFCLNLLKSIINQTPTIVVLAVIPTLFRRLESRSYEDAIQLTGNRLYERIRIPSPQAKEVETFLTRREVKFESDTIAADCIAKLVDKAPQAANWKFIHRFARRAKKVKGGIGVEDCIEIVLGIEKQRKGGL